MSFLLKVLADNSAQGMDVSLADRDPDAPLEPFALRDGTTITATVKSFNEQRGFGFLKIPGASMDLYFHGRAPRPRQKRPCAALPWPFQGPFGVVFACASA